MADFEGTVGDDTITRTSLSAGVTSDPSGSLPGNLGDTYYLFQGRDSLVAGDGNDHISPGFDDDEVHAGGGDDEIWEFVVGWAQSGADRFFGDGGNDEIWGGAGNDEIDGGDGDDTLYGGDDSNIFEDDGDDFIFGRAGGDYLAGGLGSDQLDGGAGNDTLFAERELADSFDILRDTTTNRLFGGAGLDRLFGALGADRLHGDDGNDDLRGDDGNDTLLGGAGNDGLYGGAGDDRLLGGDGNDYLDGGDGLDTYVGLKGNDIFYVSDFDQTLGRFVLRSEAVKGGLGRDTLVINQLDDLAIDLRAGSVIWAENDEKLTLELVDNVQCGSGGTVVGSWMANRIEGFGNSTFRGLGGDDFLMSTGQSLRAFGGLGNDRLVGGRDNDRLFGDDGADSLYGRNGNDLLCGGGGNDRLFGNAGFGVGGGSGHDQLFGGAGNDLLQGNYRSDQLYGGAGRDTFHFTSPSDSKYGDIDHIRNGAPAGAPTAGAVRAAFEAPGNGRGDVVHLRAIDADDSRDGDQPFVFGVQRPGGLWLKDIGHVTVVHGNIDPDATAEFVLYIHDGVGVRAEDYTAADFVL